jgi:hypothetical protein
LTDEVEKVVAEAKKVGVDVRGTFQDVSLRFVDHIIGEYQREAALDGG